MKFKKNWHKDFFKPGFYNPASPLAVKKASSEISFILKKTRLKKGAGVLDLCCGPGRHSLVLARKGYKVTGFDFSEEYLKEAEKKSRSQGLDIKFIKGDMRRLKFKEEFNLVLNLFTSFGYFKEERENQKVLKGAFSALKKGGVLLMDFANPDFIKKNYKAKNREPLEDGGFLLEETVFSGDGVFCFNSWTMMRKGKAEKKSFFLRLYDKKSISAALLKAGFEGLHFWGDYKGSALSPASQRLIVSAVKKTGKD